MSTGIITRGNPICGARFSPCEKYRYVLWRKWDESLPFCAWIGLNPSTADESKDDPTIRRCIGFARAWCYGGIYMLNLFAYRATLPEHMKAAADPVGPENNPQLRHFHLLAHVTIAAWGNHGAFMDRDVAVCALNALSKTLGERMSCLRLTKGGHPSHPLYLPGDLKPIPFKVRM